MSEKEKIIKEALERAGSLENLFEEIAKSEPKELLRQRREIETGPDHPDPSLLRKYALGKVDREQDHKLTEHLMLCSKCAKTVFDIQYLEPIRSETKQSWFSRIKDLVSNLSFPVLVQLPAFARGAVSDLQQRSYSPGTELVLTLEAPADGYVTIFHGCEETGEVKWVFPLFPEDDPKVSAGQHLAPVEGRVDESQGRHFLKIFWTALPLLDYSALDLQDEEQMETAKSIFFEELEALDTADWQVTTYEYSVVES